MRANDHRWAVVLAGGEGTRLQQLTRNARGEPVPKQFCSFGGGESLLRSTLRRTGPVVPRERTLVVVVEHQRRWWSQDLAGFPAENVLVQPASRGTAPAILLGVLGILERDPEATVIVLPSDHDVEDEAVLEEALWSAIERSDRDTGRVHLLGLVPDEPETEYGWIVPSPFVWGGASAVVSFVEKPDRFTAEVLLERGALWNAFLVAARATALVDLYRRSLPELLEQTGAALANGDRGSRVRALYERLGSFDFSRDVLQHLPGRLRVVRVPPCGWTDLGTPRRASRQLLRRKDAPRTGARAVLAPGPDIARSLTSDRREAVASR